MDSDRGKIFVGGISWETTEEKLKEYFRTFGEVTEAVIMKDRTTGRARGFGFVVFADPSVAEVVSQDKHSIDGRMVEAKKAVPKEEQQNLNRSNNNSPGPVTQARTKKIFVGGLASSVTESEFRKYFEQFGKIVDVVVMYDHGTQRPRGFGFITYDSEDAVDKVLQKTFHELSGKMVEVKRAIPKELLSGSARSNGSSGYSGQGFATSPLSGAYGTKIETRLVPSLSGRGEYPPSLGPSVGYGSGGGAYTNPANGGYGSNPYGSNAILSGSLGGNLRSFGGTSSGYNASNGSGNIGYPNIASGRNIWGGGIYPTSGTSWSSSQNPASSSGSFGTSPYNNNNNNNSNSGNNNNNGGCGIGNNGFGSSPSSYPWQSNGFGSSTGGGGGGGGSFSSGNGSFGSRGYTADGYANMYGSGSVYTDSVWKMSEAEVFSSRMGAPGYFVSGDSGSSTDATLKGRTGYGGGGFNTTGRQAH